MVDELVIRDYNMTMMRVGVAQLKAHLSRYLRGIRHGETVVVLDRNEPVARIVPYRSEETILPVREPLKPLRDYVLPPLRQKPIDSVAVLLEDRQSGR